MLDSLNFDGQKYNAAQQQQLGALGQQHFDRYIQERMQTVQATSSLYLDEKKSNKKKKAFPQKGEKSDIRQSIEAMKAQILAVKQLEDSGILQSEL